MQAVERIGEVLGTIVCPACHGRLELHPLTRTPLATDTPPLPEGHIRCVACRKSYPIEDGIPVLLVERAVSE
jgi:uncharacterized protein YbaR (Trm112 family)